MMQWIQKWWCGTAMLAMAGSAMAGGPCGTTTDRPLDAIIDAVLSPAGTPLHAQSLDPNIFFDGLVRRYRGLTTYQDVVHMVQVTEDVGHDARRTETEMHCQVADGQLEITTPASQFTTILTRSMPVRSSEAASAAKLKRNLWLAPHMTLKFADEPLDDLRPGVADGFTPIDAASITIDEKPMVTINLKSGDPLSAHGESRCNLLVNPDSMLIEKIEFEQHLSDGSTRQTRLDITPVKASDEVPDPTTATPPCTDIAEPTSHSESESNVTTETPDMAQHDGLGLIGR